MVFFDSAREQNDPLALSLLAIRPEKRLTGSLFRTSDLQTLRDAVSELSGSYCAQDDGLPGPVVAGTVGYEGDFEFCVYHQVLVYRHAEGVWYAGGDWWKTLLEPSPAPSEIPGRLVFRPTVERSDFCGWVENILPVFWRS
jgi:hypothetical protein